MSVLGMDRREALFSAPASFLMVMLNQYVLVNVGDEKMMTLADIEVTNANRTT